MIVKAAIKFLNTHGDNQLIGDVQAVINGLTDNPNFTSPKPTLAALSAALAAFTTAKAEAVNGGKRDPKTAGYICIVVIAFGCAVFSGDKMGCDPRELEKPDDLRSLYNRLWYSLGLFLPVVDLKTSELWKPKKQYRFLRTYVRIHILLGWILVPIFLAAISGLIK